MPLPEQEATRANRDLAYLLVRFKSVLRSLDEPARRALVIPECLQAIERFPEIRHWP